MRLRLGDWISIHVRPPLSKNARSAPEGDTHSGRDTGNNTAEVKRKSEDHWCGHIP